MRLIAGLILVAGLAGCGVDGAPTKPVRPAAKSGVTISGQTCVGVAYASDGSTVAGCNG